MTTLFYCIFASLSQRSSQSVMALSTAAASSGLFAINVRVAVKPERRAEFLRVIQADAAQTVGTEPGALQFALGADATDPSAFHFHEQYKSQADLDYHFSTPHFKEWNDFCETKPFISDPIVNIYQCHHEPVKVPPRPAFCLNVELCIKEQMREEFLAVIDNNQRGSRAEPLCLQYDYGESTTEPNSFYFHEQYTGKMDGKEGFDAHSAAPHFAKWEAFAGKNPFTKDPVVSFFKNIAV